jgi:hypothetical protein
MHLLPFLFVYRFIYCCVYYSCHTDYNLTIRRASPPLAARLIFNTD